MSFLYGKAHGCNDFVKQVRGFLQGHPQVNRTVLTDPQSGITLTGTGVGELFVSTESYTPAGNPGSPAGSPEPGTKYTLTCTVAGSEVTSPQAQFTVVQVGVGTLGTLTAGEEWVPDNDVATITSPEVTSPVAAGSPQHGLRLFLNTSVDWAVSDTVEFHLVDHFIGRDANDNFEEMRFTETAADANGDFITEWICRMPSVSGVAASPETPAYTGMLTSFNDADTRRNVAVMAAGGFEASSAFASQPSGSGVRYAYLQNTPFNFWLSCDADGYYAVARPGAVYEHMTAQLIDIIATGNQHPLPLFVGAMSENNNSDSVPSQTSNDEHAAFWDGGIESSARFRWVDGSWYSFENRTTLYDKAVTSTNWVWPYKNRDTVAGSEDGNEPDAADYGWSELSHQMLPRYDGSYETDPVILMQTSPQSAVIGELKFMKYVSGNGLNAEDTSEDTSVSPAQSYIIFQNANLADNDNFIAMVLE